MMSVPLVAETPDATVCHVADSASSGPSKGNHVNGASTPPVGATEIWSCHRWLLRTDKPPRKQVRGAHRSTDDGLSTRIGCAGSTMNMAPIRQPI
jgi:hypothetical protein